MNVIKRQDNFVHNNGRLRKELELYKKELIVQEAVVVTEAGRGRLCP